MNKIDAFMQLIRAIGYTKGHASYRVIRPEDFRLRKNGLVSIERQQTNALLQVQLRAVVFTDK